MRNPLANRCAVTKSGVFKVHSVGSRLYFEIPRAELGKDYVIVTTLAGTPDEIGIRGTQGGNNLVRFERRDNRIFVREADYRDIIADTASSQRLSAELIGVTKILAALNIEAYGPDSSAVVEVTRMFTGGVAEYTALGRRATVDAARSYIDRFAAYSRNVNVTAVQSFTPQAGAPGDGGGFPGTPAAATAPTTEKYTFSIAKLPDVPMQPRLLDERVGYFGVQQRDFSGATQRVETRRYISRWRLECSDKRVGNLACPRSGSRITSTPPRRRGSSRGSRRASKIGRWPSKLPASTRASWPPKRRPTIPTSPVKTPPSPWCVGFRRPPRTPSVRRSRIHAPVKSSTPTCKRISTS